MPRFNYLSDLRLLASGRAAEFVKFDVKPAVDISVDNVVLVADLLTREPLFQRLQPQS